MFSLTHPTWRRRKDGTGASIKRAGAIVAVTPRVIPQRAPQRAVVAKPRAVVAKPRVAVRKPSVTKVTVVRKVTSQQIGQIVRAKRGAKAPVVPHDRRVMDFTDPEVANALPLLVMIQIGNWDVYQKMRPLTQMVRNVPHHVVFSLVPSLHDKAEVMYRNWPVEGNTRSCHVLLVENRGMDVGAFVASWLHVKRNAEQYAECKTIFKAHTKTNDRWREQLLNPMIRSQQYFYNALARLAHKQMGMFCSRRWLLPADTFEHTPNTPIINALLNEFGLKRRPGFNRFVAGTVFMMKRSVLDRFFEDAEKTERLLARMPEGRVNDWKTGQLPHSLERVLCYAVTFYGLQIGSSE